LSEAWTRLALGPCIWRFSSQLRRTGLFTQTGLGLGPLLAPDLSNLIPGSIDFDMHLVEWVLLALLELLAAKIHALLPAQTGMLLFDLGHSAGLEGSVGSLESTLGVSLHLRTILVRQRQGIQCILDTRGIESRALPAAGLVVQLGKVETASLLLGRFSTGTLGLGGQGSLLGGELCIALGLFASSLSFLGFGIFPIVEKNFFSLCSMYEAPMWTYFLAPLLDPLDHSFSSSAARFASSAAFFPAAASAFYVTVSIF